MPPYVAHVNCILSPKWKALTSHCHNSSPQSADMSLQPFQKVCGKKTDILSNSKAPFLSHPAWHLKGWCSGCGVGGELLVPYHWGQGRDNELYWQAVASPPWPSLNSEGEKNSFINILDENVTVILLLAFTFNSVLCHALVTCATYPGKQLSQGNTYSTCAQNSENTPFSEFSTPTWKNNCSE